ncbi:MAG: hypothetical protein U5J64_02670 [Halobacteriales archaeon]|nr:hypothetical protein [Halobacteriales archaeon]
MRREPPRYGGFVVLMRYTLAVRNKPVRPFEKLFAVRKYHIPTEPSVGVGMVSIQKFDRRGEMEEGKKDAEYVAVLRDIEPAGTAEFAEHFDVAQDTARRRLERLRRGDAPVNRKKIGGVLVWFVDKSELDAGAASAAEVVRKRMGIKDGE